MSTPEDDIVASFAFSKENVRATTEHLLYQLKNGLLDARLPFQHPSFVTAVPNGSETGRFLSVDLGGTNCRICLVDLHGNGTFSVEQQKHAVPANLRVNDRHEPLFDWVADKIGSFLATLHLSGILPLGFTFSFTCEQTSLADGTLLHWDKGWDLPTALHKNPCALLQAAIDTQQLPVRVAALANDSVGALLARAYTARGTHTTLACIIVGTGTNAAYVEKLSNVVRYKGHDAAPKDTAAVMAINTEWGCMDDDLRVLPRTRFDDMVDARSTDRGAQMLEKRVSGLYLGELLRLAIVELYEKEAGAFAMTAAPRSPLFTTKSIDASLLSALASDAPVASHITLLEGTLGARNVSTADVAIVQNIAAAIVTRAARIIGAATAAIVLQSGLLLDGPATHKSPVSGIRRHVRLILSGTIASCFSRKRPKNHPSLPIIDIGVTGSVIEHHPTFKKEMRAALCQVQGIGAAGEARIRLSQCLDASAVGAALMVRAAIAQEDANSSTSSSDDVCRA